MIYNISTNLKILGWEEIMLFWASDDLMRPVQWCVRPYPCLFHYSQELQNKKAR